MEERRVRYDTTPRDRDIIIQYGRNEHNVTQTRHEKCNSLNVNYKTFCGIINRDKKNNPDLYPSNEQVRANKQRMKHWRQQQQQQQYYQDNGLQDYGLQDNGLQDNGLQDYGLQDNDGLQEGAVGYADQAREHDLNDILTEDKTEGINKADTMYKRGNYQKALDRYEKLVNSSRCKDEELPHVFLMMANAYFFTFDLKNALTYCDKAIEEANKMGNDIVKKLAEQNLKKVHNSMENLGNISIADNCTELERLMATMNIEEK
ncbi:uncharacterized protein [Cherax quadricarinatus]|uniref:uncharacterized protein n=1 Tax=Cherax quadricarinatus TaxID=27406 RepID=UPI0023780690|nr:uncharacterized protein LOC128698918 [Cherax quadricarinatus]